VAAEVERNVVSEAITAGFQLLLDIHKKNSGYVVQSACSKRGESYLIICLQTHACLLDAGGHMGNNAYLVCAKGRVWYRCHSDKCKNKDWELDLGDIPELFGNAYARGITRMISREVLLQGRPHSEGDIDNVMNDVLAIFTSGDFSEEQNGR